MAKDTTGRLRVTVKSGGRLKLSSKLWLERQLNDPYVAQAKRDGLRSRAAYKLIEIDDKHHFLKSGITVVDLGAAPGGWSQIAAKRVGAADGKGKVVAIDLLEMPEIAGVTFAQLDFLSQDAPEKLLKMMGGRADVVLSDMAANTTGHRKTDQLRILGLVEGAAAFASDVLNPGGTFVAKVFQSGADAALMTQLKHDFATVKHVKPASSRKDLLGTLCAGDGISRLAKAAAGRACVPRPSRHRQSLFRHEMPGWRYRGRRGRGNRERQPRVPARRAVSCIEFAKRATATQFRGRCTTSSSPRRGTNRPRQPNIRARICGAPTLRSTPAADPGRQRSRSQRSPPVRRRVPEG